MHCAIVVFVLVLLIGAISVIKAESIALKRLAGSPIQLQSEQQKIAAGWTETGTFTTKLDHFNALDASTFKLRYAVNDTFYGGPGSPIFFFLAGEAPMDFFNFQTVQIREAWAQQYSAMYVQLEHRYYGASFPFLEATTEKMKYLSSEQALADAADFLVWFKDNKIKQSAAASTQVVTFGCSYSGALSAWFRLKYPQHTVGSIAPSGPVLAQLNYTGYFGWFSHAASPQCSSSVQQASDQIYSLSENEAGRQQLSKTFHTCQPLNANNTWYFLNTLMGVVGGSDQMDNPPDWPLNATCDKLLSSPSSGVDGVIDNWADLALGSSPCLDVNEQTLIEAMGLPIPSDSRSWLWQKCSQFGFFKPSYPGTSIFFPNQDVEHILKYCQDAFGIKTTAAVEEYTNIVYGGKQLASSQTLFTNGLKDPWHLLSITENTGNVEAVTYNAGHCAPLTQAYPSDPPSLLAARQKVADFIGELLNH